MVNVRCGLIYVKSDTAIHRLKLNAYGQSGDHSRTRSTCSLVVSSPLAKGREAIGTFRSEHRTAFTVGVCADAIQHLFLKVSMTILIRPSASRRGRARRRSAAASGWTVGGTVNCMRCSGVRPQALLGVESTGTCRPCSRHNPQPCNCNRASPCCTHPFRKAAAVTVYSPPSPWCPCNLA
jgi:hypothetical protein